MGKVDRLITISFPQEKLQFPRNTGIEIWATFGLTEREAYRPGMRPEPVIPFSWKVRPMWGSTREGDEISLSLFHF